MTRAHSGRALWWAPLPSIPLLETEQAPEHSSTGPAILAPALEGPLLPADQQKVWILYLIWILDKATWQPPDEDMHSAAIVLKVPGMLRQPCIC